MDQELAWIHNRLIIWADSCPGPSDCKGQHPTSNVRVETKLDDTGVPLHDVWREGRLADG